MGGCWWRAHRRRWPDVCTDGSSRSPASRCAGWRGWPAGEADVEAVQLFGDRLHLRVAPGAAEPVMERLPQTSPGPRTFRWITCGLWRRELEDVFIELLESEPAGLA